jgi:hypothetical protein
MRCSNQSRKYIKVGKERDRLDTTGRAVVLK